jgi:hypothetical protein
MNRQVMMWRFIIFMGALAVAVMFFQLGQSSKADAQATGSVPANVPCYINNGTGTNGTAAYMSCRALPGTIRGYRILSTASAPAWLKLYNLRTMPNCASSTGFVESIPIGALTAPARWGIVDTVTFAFYSQGVGFCITGGTGAPTDGTAPPAGIYGVVFTGS